MKTDTKLNVIIFSCDRPMQLETCLQSLYCYLEQDESNEDSELETKVIWRASNEQYRKSYEELQKEIEVSDICTNVSWIEQTSFQQNTLFALRATNAPYTMFLVDDIVFLNSFSIEDTKFWRQLIDTPDKLLSISLRLHKGVTYCYALDRYIDPPDRFVKGGIWNWKQFEGDWGYPFSLDGNVYNTLFILQAVSAIPQFRNPNDLEARLDQLKHHVSLPPYMACYKEQPKLINVPINISQNEFANRSNEQHSTSLKYLNDLFRQGYGIEYDDIEGQTYNSVHVPQAYEQARIIKRFG